jgi:hypothetical protein
LKTSPYFFYSKQLPAPAFPPAPLPGPVPPKLRSDVYQKSAPRDFTPLEGSENQVVCGWALSTKTCVGIGFHHKTDMQVASTYMVVPHLGSNKQLLNNVDGDGRGGGGGEGNVLEVSLDHAAAGQKGKVPPLPSPALKGAQGTNVINTGAAGAAAENNNNNNSNNNSMKSMQVTGGSWATPPLIPWPLDDYAPFGQWRCCDYDFEITVIGEGEGESTLGSVDGLSVGGGGGGMGINGSGSLISGTSLTKESHNSLIRDAQTRTSIVSQNIQQRRNSIAISENGGLGSRNVTPRSSVVNPRVKDIEVLLGKLLPVKVGNRYIEGGIPYEFLAILVRAPKPRPKPLTPPPQDDGPFWDYKFSSLFLPRAVKKKDAKLNWKLSHTDAKSMHDNLPSVFIYVHVCVLLYYYYYY